MPEFEKIAGMKNEDVNREQLKDYEKINLEIGEKLLILLVDIKHTRNNRVKTSQGDKSLLGLGACIKHIVNEAMGNVK